MACSPDGMVGDHFLSCCDSKQMPRPLGLEQLRMWSPYWVKVAHRSLIAEPLNAQHDRVYAPRSSKKKEVATRRLFKMHHTFIQQVSYGVCWSVDTWLYWQSLLTWGKDEWFILPRNCIEVWLLPAMRHISGDSFIFQHDNAPAHRARDTVEFLKCEVPPFITPELWPPNSPDLNPVDYKIWRIMQQRVYETKMRRIVRHIRTLLNLITFYIGYGQCFLLCCSFYNSHITPYNNYISIYSQLHV